MTEYEKNEMSKMATSELGIKSTFKSYEQQHPLQQWITYWTLETWKTKDVIFQIGNNYMKRPEDPAPTDIRWNLVYSDFNKEKNIIDNYMRSK